LSHELEEEIIAVADFCTMVRSGIITNEYNGQIIFVPQPEMPARMFEQMLALGSTFAYMRKLDNPKLDDEDALVESDLRIMYKIAFDSIPVTRRIALSYLVKFTSGVETSALATKINYPTQVVQAWLEQLNALGVVRRAKTSSGTNKWVLKDEYITLMEKLQGVKATHGTLADRDVDSNDAPEHHWQKEIEQEKRFLTDDEWRERAENDDNDF
jgi:hypothetical protein